MRGASVTPTADWGQVISFIWSVKEVLRDHYKRHQYGEVILPMVALRRLDATLAADSSRTAAMTVKQDVLARAAKLQPPYDHHSDLLCHTAGLDFYNTSKYDFESLLGDENAIEENFGDYLNGFSANVREIIQAFDLHSHVEKMARGGVLYAVVGRFADPRIDLSPANVSNLDMGYIYEEIIRTVAELSNEEAGEHFTPREVIELMTTLLVTDDPDLHRPGKVITVYDPTCGTGGMLTVAEARLKKITQDRVKVHIRGQEVQEESFAICRSDMLIKGEKTAEIRREDTLKRDMFEGQQFDYVIANPPYGKDWKPVEKAVKADKTRFGIGLPSTTDGQMLFLQHMLAKMKSREEGGGRLAVVMNGSPLFAGDAGSGPSKVREHFIANDLVEAIIGVPTELFYNTGIPTYIWIVTNKKAPEREGYVQLIDARRLSAKMLKSLGNKRNLLAPKHIARILAEHDAFAESDISRIIPNIDFGYVQVTVERPLWISYRIDDRTKRLLCRQKAAQKLPDADLALLLAELDSRTGWTGADETEAETAAAAIAGQAGVPQLRVAVLKALTVRDPASDVVVGKNDKEEADAQLRSREDVPLTDDVDDYFKREVQPYWPDAWLDRRKDRVGYSIPFSRIFYGYKPPRPLTLIDAEIKASQDRVRQLIEEVAH